MKTIYVRITKKFITGTLKGIVVTDVFQVDSEISAQNHIAINPKGRIQNTITGAQAEVLASDFVTE